jgi:hypothetical protein
MLYGLRIRKARGCACSFCADETVRSLIILMVKVSLACVAASIWASDRSLRIEMSFTVFLADNGKYIICRVIGPMTASTAVEFTKEMDLLSQVHKINRFLTDVRDAPNTSSAMENLNFTQNDMKNLDLQKNVRAAILIRPRDRSHDFVEFATQNAGYNVRLFDDEVAAISWLEE